jgi:hypothetical protein
MGNRVVGGTVIFLGQQPHGLKGSHTAHARSRYGLTIDIVSDITRGIDAFDRCGG